MELDAAAKMEGVGDSVGAEVPGFREAGNNLRVGSEARQPIEDVGNRASGRDIRRKCGIHRSRVVSVTRVDDRFA